MPTRLTDLTDPDDLRAVAAFLLGMAMVQLLDRVAPRDVEEYVIRRALRSRTLHQCGDAT